MSEPDPEGITIVTAAIPLAAVQGMAEAGFGDLVKAVVDVERGVMAIGGDLHADAEQSLLDDGARQADLWGINLYPEHFGRDGWIEYDSLINIRPRRGNRSRVVEDAAIRGRIAEIVEALVNGDA